MIKNPHRLACQWQRRRASRPNAPTVDGMHRVIADVFVKEDDLDCATDIIADRLAVLAIAAPTTSRTHNPRKERSQ